MKRICEPVIIGLKLRKITERSTIMVNIQLRRIISIGNHYTRYWELPEL